LDFFVEVLCKSYKEKLLFYLKTFSGEVRSLSVQNRLIRCKINIFFLDFLLLIDNVSIYDRLCLNMLLSFHENLHNANVIPERIVHPSFRIDVQGESLRKKTEIFSVDYVF